MIIDLFISCVMDQFYPETAKNVVKILNMAGVDVEYNPEQTCCGKFAYKSGFVEEAKELGEKFLHDFPNDRAVVGVNASCVGYIKTHYKDLFYNTASHLEYKRLVANIYELTDFLVNKINFLNFGAEFNHRVVYKDTCCSLREMGLKDEAAQIAKALLDGGKAPLDVINEFLIPALDDVGKDFENGKVFLPKLLMSAVSAGAAFDKVKVAIEAGGTAQEKKGKILLATVKGDIHDIGKNIVKTLLENYGYDVLDLGRDVAPEKVVEAAVKEDINLVGLSALMTTTVVNMEETIRLLKAKRPECKIMVGGAVLTKDYAESIGADFYGKDAMASVGYAKEVL